MSGLAFRLAEKIESDLGIRCDPDTFCRTYAGRNQKAAGAFVWMMQEAGGIRWVGSCWPAAECVKKKYRLYLGTQGEIFPEK